MWPSAGAGSGGSPWAQPSWCQEPGPRGCALGSEGNVPSLGVWTDKAPPLGVLCSPWWILWGPWMCPAHLLAGRPAPPAALARASGRALACAISAHSSFWILLGCCPLTAQPKHLCHHVPDLLFLFITIGLNVTCFFVVLAAESPVPGPQSTGASPARPSALSSVSKPGSGPPPSRTPCVSVPTAAEFSQQGWDGWIGTNVNSRQWRFDRKGGPMKVLEGNTGWFLMTSERPSSLGTLLSKEEKPDTRKMRPQLT